MATTRRDLLKRLAAVGGTALLLDLRLGPGIGRRPEGEAAPAAETVAYHWRDPGTLAAQALSPAPVYTSAAYRAPGAFNAVGSLWTGQVAGLELRASPDGSDWTSWHSVADDAEPLDSRPDGRAWGDLFTGAGWRYVQYQVSRLPGQPPTDVELVLIDSSAGPAATGPLDQGPAGPAAATPPPIVSRAGWGCDEGLPARYGIAPWPPEYRVVQKGIVHHTATSNTYTDGAIEVRAIYFYHAVTLGWADIGYNYLVDRFGNVYEGRKGGPNVVGGHALQYNYGSTGIAGLGNFMSTPPSSALTGSLARIVAWTCRYLDPHGQGYFVDRIYANLLGHRDVLATACPGDLLYTYLPALRDAVQAMLGAVPSPTAQIIGVAFVPTRVQTGTAMQVAVTVANSGSGTMFTQPPAPGFIYAEGQSFRQAGFLEDRGSFRVGVDFDGNATGVDHPYRWGLADALEPGQSATVVGFVRLSSLRAANYWAGVVQEAIAWQVDHAGTTAIKVLPAICFAPAPAAAAASAPQPPASTGQPRVYLPLVTRGPCD